MHERNVDGEMERDGKRRDARDYANDWSEAAKHGEARDGNLGQPVSQCRSKLTQLGGRDAYAPARDMHERNLPREMERDGERSDARDYANDRSEAAKHGQQSWSIARDSSLG